MNTPKPEAHELVPVEGTKQLAENAAEKAVERLVPEASAQQRKALVTLIAPWAEKLVRALDDLVRIPGTDLGIGLDAIIGFFFPGAGDVVTGIGSIALLFLALRHKVPTVAIGRMLINIAIDTIAGSVPVAGDLFDVFWKSNRKNLDIIQKFKDNPKEKPHAGDYVLVTLGVVMAVTSFVLPLVIVFVFGASLLTLLGGALAAIFGGSAAH